MYFRMLAQYESWVSRGRNALKVDAAIVVSGIALVLLRGKIPPSVAELIGLVGGIVTIALIPFIIVTMKYSRMN